MPEGIEGPLLCGAGAPHRPDGVNLNTLRTNEALAENTQPLVWGLREVLDYAEVVLNRDDVDAKADAFIDFLADRVVGRDYQDDMLRGRPFQVQSFADLEEFFRAIFDFMEALGKGGEVWKTHHLATIRKIRNRLSNISTRSKGLVTDDGAANDLPWGRFADRSVHWILGGRAKGADPRELRDAVRRKAARVYLIGESADKFRDALADLVPVEMSRTLDRAVETAAAAARPGEAVVLSPACASFDQFRDFNDRGDQFQKLVRARLGSGEAG